jgi:protease secretion system membrane fusion protein
MMASQNLVDENNYATHQNPVQGGRRSVWLVRASILVLTLGLLGFVTWGALAPLDEGVPTFGQVTIDTKRKAVQHLQGGIVSEVLVREGDEVSEGQVLMRLDDAATRANYESVRQRYLSLRATESRLITEQVGKDRIEVHPDVKEVLGDPVVRRQIEAQAHLFETRRLGLKADIQAFEENIRGQEGQILSFNSMLESRQTQRRLVVEQLDKIRDLVSEGYAPRNQQLDLERLVAELTATVTELQGNALRAKQTIAELRQRIVARHQEYRKETDGQLVEVARDAQSDQGKVIALQGELERTVVKSPATGQVVGLAFQTVGGVIAPGQKLMDIVPASNTLLLETRIPPNLIDSVKAGLQADVRFSSFAHSPQLVVNGKVISVSGDLIYEPPPAASYFLARIEITPEGMGALGERKMHPGMPAEIIIRTGERTLLTYLLNPLTRRLAASMKER